MMKAVLIRFSSVLSRERESLLLDSHQEMKRATMREEASGCQVGSPAVEEEGNVEGEEGGGKED